ncbi:MAG: PEP-CTERM sorting domain-containing protein [Paucibacter sp.]|nr:PEP-CTERM sorting domain-containing protein [Roseateles sp.]
MRHIAAAGLAFFALAAQADTLDFSGAICSAAADGSGSFESCSNFSRINQAYGDSAGVDVSYQASPGSADSMYYWADSYSGMNDVAFGDVNSTPTILIVPTAGNTVSLAGFDIGAWQNADRVSQVTVIDLAGGTTLLSTGAITIFGVAPTHFTINASSSAGFSIAFGPEGYNVGIDNIAFTATAVPEPTTLALLLAGLAAVGAATRARRA